jgi:hypothetical protein
MSIQSIVAKHAFVASRVALEEDEDAKLVKEYIGDRLHSVSLSNILVYLGMLNRHKFFALLAKHDIMAASSSIDQSGLRELISNLGSTFKIRKLVGARVLQIQGTIFVTPSTAELSIYTALSEAILKDPNLCRCIAPAIKLSNNERDA